MEYRSSYVLNRGIQKRHHIGISCHFIDTEREKQAQIWSSYRIFGDILQNVSGLSHSKEPQLAMANLDTGIELFTTVGAEYDIENCEPRIFGPDKAWQFRILYLCNDDAGPQLKLYTAVIVKPTSTARLPSGTIWRGMATVLYNPVTVLQYLRALKTHSQYKGIRRKCIGLVGEHT